MDEQKEDQLPVQQPDVPFEVVQPDVPLQAQPDESVGPTQAKGKIAEEVQKVTEEDEGTKPAAGEADNLGV